MIWLIYTLAAIGAGWETWLSTKDKKGRFVITVMFTFIWPLFLGAAVCAVARDMGYNKEEEK